MCVQWWVSSSMRDGLLVLSLAGGLAGWLPGELRDNTPNLAGQTKLESPPAKYVRAVWCVEVDGPSRRS